MTAPTAGARQVVLEHIAGPGHGDVALYAAPGPGGVVGSWTDPSIHITAADFRALGSPERITVTIEAGERLTEEDPRG